MDDSQICSLCVVVPHKENLRLRRIADVQNNELVPFELDRQQKKEGYNSNLIFTDTRIVLQKEDIQYWNWHVVNNQHRSFKCTTLKWIEYLQFDDVFSPQTLRQKLSKMMTDVSEDHDYLIQYDHSGASYRCVYLPGKMLTRFRSEQPLFKLKDDVSILNVYDINPDDIGTIKLNHLPEFCKKYYTKTVLGIEKDHFYTCTPESAIKKLITENIKSYFPALTKNDRRTIHGFLGKIPDLTLTDIISDLYKCDDDIARQWISDFVSQCEMYLDGKDVTAEALSRLIESNTEIACRFRDLVNENWKKEQAVLIQKEQQALESVRLQVKQSSTDLNDAIHKKQRLDKTLQELEGELSRLEAERQEQLSCLAEIAKKIKEKICTAQNDVAAFLSEYALFSAWPSPNHPTISSLTDHTVVINSGKTWSDQPDELQNTNELINQLAENLRKSGVFKEHASMLASYLSAAYFKKVPLILAGYGATDIADTVAVTLQNRTADKVYCYGKTNVSPLFDESINHITVLYDVFQNNNMNLVLQNVPTSSRYFYFVVPTSEELAIEPKGIYDYALPVFMEYFIEKEPNRDWKGFLSSMEVSLNSSVRIKTSLPEHIVSPFTFRRCNELLALTSETNSCFSSFLLQTMPIMRSLDKQIELMDLVETSDLLESEKRILRVLANEAK